MSIMMIVLASWVCPVLEGNLTGADGILDLDCKTQVFSWSGVIEPVESELQFVRDMGGWDFSVTERMLIESTDGTDGRFCIDLGTVSETRRTDVRVLLDERELAPCSCLAVPLFDLDEGLSIDGRFVVKYDSFLDSSIVCTIEDMAEYRDNFPNEEEFRSAVPETGRSYLLEYNVPESQGTRQLEISYTVRGWSHLTGPQTFDYSLLNILLWAENGGEASLLFEPGERAAENDWSTSVSNGERLSGSWSVTYQIEDIQNPFSTPVYSISQIVQEEVSLSGIPAGTI